MLQKVKNVSFNDANNFVRRAQHEGEQDIDGFYCDQFNNPDNRDGHYNDTGREIVEQMEGRLDVFVMGAGTGATINGVSHYLKDHLKVGPTVVLSDPTGSSLHNWAKFGTLFTEEEKEGYKKRVIFRTMVEGIGLNYLCKNTEGALIDSSEKVSDHEALNVARYMVRHEGMLIGSTTAVNLAAVIKHVKRTGIKEKRVLTIACDDGFRHISKFYSKEKWEEYGVAYEEVDVSNEMDLSFVAV